MVGWARTTWQWLDRRLGVSGAIPPLLTHPVPRGTGWWYVFGSATAAFFTLQVVTGILLALVYVPSTDAAFQSLRYLNYDYPMGWLLRAMHNFGASGMVVMMLAHVLRVFLMGAYKYPRELTWLVGVGLFGVTLGMAFTGQILRWDSDAYWALGVGMGILGRVPWIGEPLIRLVLGGPVMGPATLSRFFVLHVFVLVGLLGALLGLHLYLVLKLGISTPPGRGKRVDPQTYQEEYERELKAGVPFFPGPMLRDAIVAAGVIVGMVAAASILGPKGPNLPADPSIMHVYPRPDWYFLPLFSLYALAPDYLQTFVLVVLPLVIGAVLIAVPFVSGKGERSPFRRPVAVLSVLVLFLAMGVLEYMAFQAPWSPVMLGWSSIPTPKPIVKRLTPEELAGATVFQYKSCRNCHALEGRGGHRGPDLTHEGMRLSRDELVRQVIQGGENMPPFGDRLKPAEIDALVGFLQSLRPAGVPPAESPPRRLRTKPQGP
jgi:ubiquinol-cytochrome c reductase cytochrome b subunit